MQARPAGVYYLDWKIRQGQLGPFIRLPFLDLARRGDRRRGCVGWSHLRQETRSSGTASQRPNRSEGRARADEKRRNPCAMAQEAEALREKRARQIKTEAELEAASLLRQAAETIMESPAGLELRRMQIVTEVGAEQNNMIIIMMPSEFVEMARAIGARSAEKGEGGRV